VVTTVDFFLNKTASGVIDGNSEALTGTLTHEGGFWVLRGISLPADVAAGSTVEIIARATDSSNKTYTHVLDNVSVATPAPLSITSLAALSFGGPMGQLIAGGGNNAVIATVSDPTQVKSVEFFVNKTASGVIDASSEALTGTSYQKNQYWALTKVTLPADILAGSTVEIVVRVTDLSNNTLLKSLDNVSIVAVPAPSITSVMVLSHDQTLFAGSSHNILAALISDPGNQVKSVDFFVNKTASGTVDASSEAITGTIMREGAGWILQGATMPADVAAGSSVEIVVRVTELDGTTIFKSLDNVSVVTPVAQV
jgi:hypothetical protein